MKKVTRAIHPLDNAIYGVERSVATSLRCGGKRKGRAPVCRHGSRPVALALANDHHKSMEPFDAVWRRIEEHAGKEFRTKTGLPFTYEIVGMSVVPDRTGYPLHVSNFRAAFDLLPLSGPGQINTLVRGPAYVYAILVDQRIVQ